jgi:hypothetical protein
MAAQYREEAVAMSSSHVTTRRPLSWARRDQVRDILADIGRPNPIAPALAPAEGSSVEVPWALAIALSPPLPFVVRVGAGINMDGQSGGLWIDYYFAVFGAHWLVHRQSRGAF